MKYIYLTVAGIGLFGTLTASSQQRTEGVSERTQAVKYTLMERFEPDLVLTTREREALKAKRFAEIKLKMRILDTLDISDRKREKLREDLIEAPFSPRLSKTWAEVRFEDEQ